MTSHVLVVDDDQAFCGLAARLIAALGLGEVVQAGSVAAALEASERLEPAAALVDVGLPDGDGVDLARRLAAERWTPRVVLTSSDPDAATRSGTIPFIAKHELADGDLGSLLSGAGSSVRTVPASLRIVIGEDDVLLREGISRLLEEAGLDIVALTGNADDLVRRTLALRPDVAVIDVQMPPRHEDDGLRAAIALRERLPAMGVVVLSQFYEESYAHSLIGDRPEGVGYLLKERVADVPAFVDAIRRVAAGGSALDPEIVGRILGRRRTRGPLDDLTPRERDVLAAMAEGLTNKGIADALVVSEAAVEKHVTRIFNKLGLGHSSFEHRRVHAVLTYMRNSGR